MELSHEYGQIGDLRMHWVTAGAGETAVLLHGWPQTWYEWRHLIPALATGYRVVAPDLRGWGESERPEDGYDDAVRASCAYYANTWASAGQIRQAAETCGHLIPEERPAELAELVTAFLAGAAR